jgi:sugar lactone lactonase YvrE
MSGSNPLLRSALAASIASAMLALSPAGAAPPISLEGPAGPPLALRTERILDREALEALGVPRPSRLKYDTSGNLYVLDAVSRRVVKLDPRGTPLLDLGGYGEDEASFTVPCDLAVDARQSLLVLDRGKGAVIAFDGNGRFLAARSLAPDVATEAFAPSARLMVDPFGALWLLAPRSRDLLPLDERLARSRRSRFLAPEESLGAVAGAAFLPGGGVWIHDPDAGALRRFGASGRLLGTVSLRDSTGFAAPSELAADGGGYLYVPDVEGQRILVYDPQGVLRFTRPLGGSSVPWRPAGLAISRLDRVAIADPDRGEIQIFTIERGNAP